MELKVHTKKLFSIFIGNNFFLIHSYPLIGQYKVTIILESGTADNFCKS